MKTLPNEVIIKANQENGLAELIETMNRKQIIENHPFEIYTIMRKGQTYFVTYVFDETKKDNRKQLSAKTKENLENKIYNDYKQKTLLTFEKVSWEWLAYYKTTVKDTTFARTMSDYNRFIPNCSFLHKSITAIKPLDIKMYLQNTILNEHLRLRAYTNLKSLLNGIFTYSVDKEYLTRNPMFNLTVSTANLEHPARKVKEAEVFTNMERDLLRDYIKADSGNYKTTAPYAILLSFQLALRVGELISLKWSDIDLKKGIVHIQRQEVVYDKYNEKLEKEIVYCPECDAELDGDEVFCPQCGKKLH